MLPTKVALISKSASVKLDELTHVANALSMQIAHAFNPVWGISTTVTAFAGHTVPRGTGLLFSLKTCLRTKAAFIGPNTGNHLRRSKPATVGRYQQVMN
jgi:hypothetical protein